MSHDRLKLTLGLTSAIFFFILLLAIFLYFKRSAKQDKITNDIKNSTDHHPQKHGDHQGTEAEDLVTFQGGQDLTISDILEAPGEVIGKSNYGTLYKAFLQKCKCVRLLRFLRPVCTARVKDFADVVELLGYVRHQNLVPLLGFYAGPRGEKLLIHPFYRHGNLAQFIRERDLRPSGGLVLDRPFGLNGIVFRFPWTDGNAECHKWPAIYGISIGIAEGLDHLHTGLQKPIIHGNLKSKNILLDHHFQPCISDFGLHLLLNPTAGQEMLEASAAEGYKAPELIKMKEATVESDIYSLGVILLELLSGKEPINENPTADEDFYLSTFMRNAVLDRRLADLYHPDVLLSNGSDNARLVTEECIFKFFQLAMACCSPSPSLRPNIKQILWKLEEIGR